MSHTGLMVCTNCGMDWPRHAPGCTAPPPQPMAAFPRYPGDMAARLQAVLESLQAMPDRDEQIAAVRWLMSWFGIVERT